MSTQPLNIISRYGEDDISLWTVDVKFEDYKRVAGNAVQLQGNFKEIVNQLPTVEEDGEAIYFVFSEDRKNILDPNVTILAARADASFCNRYEMRGYSVRGPIKDVLYDYITMDDPVVTVTMTVSEAYELSSVADLEIVSCEDAQRKRTLEAAMAKLEKAIGQVPIPDYEMEAEESDDLEV